MWPTIRQMMGPDYSEHDLPNLQQRAEMVTKHPAFAADTFDRLMQNNLQTAFKAPVESRKTAAPDG